MSANGNRAKLGSVFPEIYTVAVRYAYMFVGTVPKVKTS